MSKLPSAEEINAITKALQSYFIALGRVAHSWNHLHEELGKVFCAVAGLDLSVGMAIWHKLRSDFSQREILQGAITAKVSDTDWDLAHPGALNGVTFLLTETQSLSDKRNDAIHAPCHVLPGATEFEITPISYFGNPRARKLIGKDILSEFDWYERWANAIKSHATEVRLAIDSGTHTWPKKPDRPTRGQLDHRG